MHIFVFGDSNSWGYLSDGIGNKYEKSVLEGGQLGANINA